MSRTHDIKPDALVFDLDGTLWNASPVSAKAWTEGARHCGINRNFSVAEIQSVAGLSLLDCGRKLLPDVPESELKKTVSEFSLYEKAAFEKETGVLFPGVKNGLEELAKQYPLYVVSNCETWYLNHFLERQPVGRLFKDAVCFATFGQQKAYNLNHLKEKHHFTQGLYLGDTAGDFHAARKAGFTFCYASYGFGSVPEKVWSVASFTEFLDQISI